MSITKTVTVDCDVDVEIDLEDFSVHDLIDELDDRIYSNSENLLIKEFCKRVLWEDSDLPSQTLEDELKLKLFSEASKKYSLNELEERLK